MVQRENIIVSKVVTFAVSTVSYCERLELQRKFVIAKQLLRSGTSIGANVFESQHAESRRDFIHKMKIAMKEANETAYWLLLCEKSTNYENPGNLKTELNEIMRILTSIISSAKEHSSGA